MIQDAPVTAVPAAFDVAGLPRIVFGPGRISELAGLVAPLGRRVLLVTGARSFRAGPHWAPLVDSLKKNGELWDLVVAGEPSPELVDEAVAAFRPHAIEVVVAIGGGSVLDAGKAIAGLLPFGNSVLDHLEGVGRGVPYTGPALPFVAVPTTAGTGSEATKNAVLSRRGQDGFKKSFRHETLVPRVALVDPELLAGCPPEQMAANGMDALTQLLESYVSTRASAFTDALARDGLARVAAGFEAAWRGGDSEAARAGRAAMAYGALLSGITLAQAGLGSVHGIASPLGAFFPVPHGVACGTLVAEATRVNIAALRERMPDAPALAHYAEAGRILTSRPELDRDDALAALVDHLAAWAEHMDMPRLGRYGITEADVPRIVAESRGNSMKTNPVELTDTEIAQVITARL